MSVLFLLVSCGNSHRLIQGESGITKFENGIYIGACFSITGACDVFVEIKDSLAISESISDKHGNIVRLLTYNDTLHRLNSVTFIGSTFELKIVNKHMYLSSVQNNKKKNESILLVKGDDTIYNTINTRHNLLRFFSIGKNFDRILDSMQKDNPQRDKMIIDYKSLQSDSVLCMDQADYYEMLILFCKTYSINY